MLYVLAGGALHHKECYDEGLQELLQEDYDGRDADEEITMTLAAVLQYCAETGRSEARCDICNEVL